LTRALGFTPLVAAPNGGDDNLFEQYGPLPSAHWDRPGLGYDPGFLTTPIPLAPIYAAANADGRVAPLLAGAGTELKYWHFSAVVEKMRKFPLLTAVNIDGRKLRKIKRKDTWRRDARLADEYQPDDEFYVRTRAREAVYFSRGHQVRLLDPCWGDNDDDARRGMVDTFHFTNAAPQVQTYNDSDWGDLEDYVLDKAQTSLKRLTVFTGPIFRPEDPLYGRERPSGPWRIPLSFWKIAVLQKTDDRIAAAAFIIGQIEYVRALYDERVFTGLKPYTLDEMRDRHIQTTIDVVEHETGLDFGVLKPFDAHGSLESTRPTRLISRLDDVVI
jgi:endonuclease G